MGYNKSLLLFSFAGFDAVTVANNHFNDFGSVGANFSVEILKNIGIRYFGISFGNYDSSQVYFYHFFQYTLLGVSVLSVGDFQYQSWHWWRFLQSRYLCHFDRVQNCLWIGRKLEGTSMEKINIDHKLDELEKLGLNFSICVNGNGAPLAKVILISTYLAHV